jgi:cytochrome b pre-mRNA-processing protein 3
MGEAFYGRKAAYDAALAAHDPGALTSALARNVFGGAPGPVDNARRLAAYAGEAVRQLAVQDGATLRRGKLSFPDPEAAAPALAPAGGSP